MPRPVWRGHIAFGLVSIPVVLYSAEHRSELQFRMLDSRNNARVRYERVNEETGDEVPWDKIVRAFEYDAGNYVVLSDEDFQRAAPESSHSADIECFVPRDAICAKWFDKPYYLVPDRKAKGEKGYALLRDALEKSRRVGIATVVIRTRAHLAALIPEGEVLLLNLLRYHQELHRVEDLGLPAGTFEAPRINPREREMAEQLIESMSGPWRPQDWHDEYREQLRAYIDERVAAGQVDSAPESDEPAPRRSAAILDMTALLKRSLERRQGKADPAPAKPKAHPEPAAKTARKPATRKTAARKTATGEPAARKPAAQKRKPAGGRKRAA
jgi:DNA end-binding protein Ku